jgi:hypothetical protein
MSIVIVQQPATASLSQSPMAYSFYESNTAVLTSSSFQYMLDLYYWTGSRTDSGSIPQYTLVKYPNNDNTGIFDVSRIINSTLNRLSISSLSQENTEWVAADLYYQYQSGSVFVTGSKQRSLTSFAMDGYQLFEESVGDPLWFSDDHWPFLSGAPATQSLLQENEVNYIGVYFGNQGTTTAGDNLQPNYFTYDLSLGFTLNETYTGLTTGSSDQQIFNFDLGKNNTTLAPYWNSLEWFIVHAYRNEGGTLTELGQPLKYNIVCNQKYPNVRIMWKNRFGEFDYFNFNMVNRQSFSVSRSQYQPQIGTFNGSYLTYNRYDSSILNYLVDTKQAISVNTNWVNEGYNDTFKQLLVSDEIYWIYNEPLFYAEWGVSSNPQGIRPITIKTDSIQFKTGVVDKLIQYSFDFDYGQSYKLIL